MASVNTNAAAITALRTLQQTNAQLDKTQSRISTGLRIGEAKDNAAYWAISTTLKSDNKSLATVKDALGLGSATVDVAYQGLNKAKDVLDEIKAKLTAATQPGVDRNVIQSEIAELQKQLVSIASSSTFSGENWLSVDSSAVDYDATKKIVASFARDANNSVSIGTVDVSIGNLALYDSSTVAGKNGILDGMQSLKGANGRDLDLGTQNAVGNTVSGGVTATVAAGVSGTGVTAGTPVPATTLGTDASGTNAYSTATYTGNLAVTGVYAAGDTITLTIGGATAELTLSTAQAASASAGAIALSEFATATLSAAPGFSLSTTGADLVITRGTFGNTAAPTITGGTAATVDAGDTPVVTTPGAPASVPGSTVTPATEAVVKSGVLTAGDFAVGDVVTIKLNVNGTSTDYSTAALTGTTLADIAAALDTALNGVANVAVGTMADAGRLVFTAAVAEDKTVFSLAGLTATAANGDAKVVTNGIGTGATRASFEGGSFAAMTLDADDNVYFKIQVDGATAGREVKIDQALVNKTLNVTTGAIGTVAEYKQVLDAALAAAGVTGVTTAVTNTDKITFTSGTVGATSKIVISEVDASAGADQMSIDKIDISSAGLTAMSANSGEDIASLLKSYIAIVNNAINSVTTAASNLGAVASRIDMQKSFVNTLMDTIDKGVGGLIDADMSEESTKLQALQVKQQLGVQALSIANQSSQNILRLFQ